ncbi:hypothetical protein JN086_08275 [Mycolicibacterium austroafricanum]|uniref:hypothetical protein n=1 Tax=Mycolicibacterium austroafricanum TaxID=39687 RepID=UPI001ABFFB46|nr:hypothetical protein [Mycolicibacterium austroafricanum]QRZ08332.1 hypothetical protein JN090_07345 [Mycolicibacterium austroafricanum]QZT69984.1 hypothetical protein JN086_08275 [Mycolicibacterium austroafricanum]
MGGRLPVRSAIEGKAIEIASMLHAHIRESLLNLVAHSITGACLVKELKAVFAAHGGKSKVLRPDNGPAMVFPSAAGTLREHDC